jgi:hypothetical protein
LRERIVPGDTRRKEIFRELHGWSSDNNER